MNLDKQEIILVISNFIMEIIEQNTPYEWIETKEPFFNVYKDKISYDYSGDTIPMEKAAFQNIVKNLGEKKWYTSKLHELLESLYINEWTPSYVSNCGKFWVSYDNLLMDKFEKWKCQNFELYDEDGNELDEDLEMNLDDILMEFLENTSHEIYCKKILKKLK